MVYCPECHVISLQVLSFTGLRENISFMEGFRYSFSRNHVRIYIYIRMYIRTCIHITFSIYTWKWTYISKYINFETTRTTIINYIAIFHIIYIYWHIYRYIYTSNMEIYIYIYISIHHWYLQDIDALPLAGLVLAPGRSHIGQRDGKVFPQRHLGTGVAA